MAIKGLFTFGIFCVWQFAFINKALHIIDEKNGVHRKILMQPATSNGRQHVCINDISNIPKFWQFPKKISFPYSHKPWTKEEQYLAMRSGHKAIDEMVDFYHSISLDRLLELGTNAASSVMDYCFGSAKDKDLHKKACDGASFVIKALLKRSDETNNSDNYFDWSSTTCQETHTKAKYLVFLNYLSKEYPGDVEIQNLLAGLTNLMQATLDDCGNLDNYMDLDRHWENDLSSLKTERLQIRHYVHKSNVLTDLYNVPDLDLGPMKKELDRFTAKLWKYLAEYKFINARDARFGFKGDRARHHAYLVTHAAYMPSGFGRHELHVEDAPWLYKYIRENYYAAMEQGDLDLFAEFIDILRSYGCSEENDVMVRHGTRFMLDMYAKEGYTWMKEKDFPREKRSSDYSLIHLPWTATAGVLRCGNGDPVVPGSFGYAFWEALERAKADERKS